MEGQVTAWRRGAAYQYILMRGLYDCPYGSDLLCGEVLCQHIYGGTGTGTGRNRSENEGKGAGTRSDKDGVWNGGK